MKPIQNNVLGKVASLTAIGAASQVSETELEQMTGKAKFLRYSGDWNGVPVHSLHGAKVVANSGQNLTLIADSMKHVKAYDSAELNVIAAGMNLGTGATFSHS